MQFTNRSGVNLNRKVFEVEEIIRDASGEIISIVGKLVRADDDCTGGTALNKETFDLMYHHYSVVNDSVELELNADNEYFAYFYIKTTVEMTVTVKDYDTSKFTHIMVGTTDNTLCIGFKKLDWEPAYDGVTENFYATVELKEDATEKIIGEEVLEIVYTHPSGSAED